MTTLHVAGCPEPIYFPMCPMTKEMCPGTILCAWWMNDERRCAVVVLAMNTQKEPNQHV